LAERYIKEKSKRLIIKLRGGLGNQMFQYAAGRIIQKNWSIPELYLDKSDLNHDKQREYALNVFKLDKSIKVIDLDERQHDTKIMYFKNKFMKYVEKYYVANRRGTEKKKKESKLYPLFSLMGVYYCNYMWFGIPKHIMHYKNIFLCSSFQRASLYRGKEDFLRKEFEIKHKSPKLAEFTEQIRKKEAVAVHIRLGDYVGNEIHQVCTENYYKKGMEYISSKVINPVFYIFSDNITYIKENIKFDYQVVFEDENNKDFESLYAMCNCKHFIISNSSFSWWAQYLSDYGDKIVVAPDKWFNVEDIPQNLYCKNWIRIAEKSKVPY